MSDDDSARAFGTARVTKQRAAIARTVAGMNCAFTIEELVRVAADTGEPISTATAYRAIAAMEANGHMERVGARGGSALFTRCAHDTHHHHIVCERCGRTEPTACPVLPQRPAGPERGFRVTRHEVTLYGVCEQCDVCGDVA